MCPKGIQAIKRKKKIPWRIHTTSSSLSVYSYSALQDTGTPKEFCNSAGTINIAHKDPRVLPSYLGSTQLNLLLCSTNSSLSCFPSREPRQADTCRHSCQGKKAWLLSHRLKQEEAWLLDTSAELSTSCSTENWPPPLPQEWAATLGQSAWLHLPGHTPAHPCAAGLESTTKDSASTLLSQSLGGRKHSHLLRASHPNTQDTGA